MSDEIKTAVVPEEPKPEVTSTPVTRVFKIGSTRVVETESTRGKNIEEVRDLLAATYPEVKSATVREGEVKDGHQAIEFLPQPGRKG